MIPILKVDPALEEIFSNLKTHQSSTGIPTSYVCVRIALAGGKTTAAKTTSMMTVTINHSTTKLSSKKPFVSAVSSNSDAS